VDRPDITWFHSFELGDEAINGLGSYDALKTRADRLFEGVVQDRTVLDVGAWDGFFSFAAEQQGAARVLATDHFCWSGQGWGNKAGFDYVHAKTSSRVESLDIDVFDLSPQTVGRFDVVLFLGVLYHLRDPFGGLERVASVCDEVLMIETAGAMFDCPEPVMRFHLGSELNNDATNFWSPNPSCLENMLRELGFKRIEFLESADGPNRILARAFRAR
jgi:tRNA (mo5U34)-methyltransferase